GSVWSSFLAGIVVAAPIGITVAIVYWFVTGPMTRLDTFVMVSTRLSPAGRKFFTNVSSRVIGPVTNQ
ncbi:MAG: hypothetical protein AAGA22_06790, partial [Pseudomonadota bacterium]